MNVVNLRDVPEEEQRSPSGKFHSFCRNVSLALGGLRNTGTWGGGHPFDLQLRRVPPGAAICPHHAHLAQWELFLLRAGRGTVRAGRRSYPVRRGDVWAHPPGEPHQLSNSGRRDLEVLILADNPPLDAFHYPDSDKWGLRPPGGFFRMTPCDYHDGEDPAPGGAGGDAPHPPPLPRPKTPFSRRKANVGDLAWDAWKSAGGRFVQRGKDLSGAVGDVPGGWPRRGHPFNLELVRVPAGRAVGPFHSHANQWELYLLLAGEADLRHDRGRRRVGPGDAFLFPPGAAHQLLNPGRRLLEFLVIADNPAADIFRYPDSDKWGVRPPGKFFRMTEVPYSDGEE